jgi:mycothiol synthase
VDLRVERVTEANEARLISYCAEYGSEHDASFLPGRDLPISAEHPAFLLLQGEAVVGAVVLMRSRRYESVRKGRFSILHSVLGTQEAYSALLGAIRPHFRALRSVYLFIPETKHDTAAILTRLGFRIERSSFVLQSSTAVVEEVLFPDGYAVQHLGPSDQVGLSQFAQCVNEAFCELAGHTDSTAADIRALFDDEGYIEGGICLLRRNQDPVGTVCLMRDAENAQAGELLALGVVNEHRGRGLGKRLLRYARSFAAGKGLDPVILSANAENETALRLYKTEGFVVTETTVCYALDCA